MNQITEEIYKFGTCSAEALDKGEPDDRRFEYPDVWSTGKTDTQNRLVIAPSRNHVDLMLKLSTAMLEPFWLLYVLLVPRADAEEGRYCITDLERSEVEQFFHRFRVFFENDGRHNVWIGSQANKDLLVYDRHNVIFAYGRLAAFEAVLSANGMASGDGTNCPFPHSHRYHQLFDQDQRDLLNGWDWAKSPLQEVDDNP